MILTSYIHSCLEVLSEESMEDASVEANSEDKWNEVDQSKNNKEIYLSELISINFFLWIEPKDERYV